MIISKQTQRALTVLVILAVFSAAFLGFSVGTTDAVGIASADYSYGDTLIDSIADKLWWFDEDYLDMQAVKAVVDEMKTSGELGDPTSADFEPVKIAVIDTGVDIDHELFTSCGVFATTAGGTQILGTNTVTDGGSINDESTKQHGTHVCGIITIMLRALGLTDYVKIMPIRASHTKSGSTLKFQDFNQSDVVEGVQWAVENGADIVNMSLTTESSVWADLTSEIAKHTNTTLFVAAAGNSGLGNVGGSASSTTVGYPAGAANVIGVMASEYSADGAVLATYSNVNGNYDIVAPGGTSNDSDIAHKIYSAGIVTGTLSAGNYCYKHGTSMASPMVSVATALLKLRVNALTSGTVSVPEMKRIILNHSTDFVSNGADEYGLLNLETLASKDMDELLGYTYNPVTSISVAKTSGALTQWITGLGAVVLTATISPENTNPRLVANWYDGDVLVGTGLTISFTPTTAGVHTLTCKISENNTLVTSNSVNVTVRYLFPNAETIGIMCDVDGKLALGETATYTLTNLSNYDPNNVVTWYVNGEVAHTGGTVFRFTPTTSGEYNVTVVYGDVLLWEEADLSVSKDGKTPDWVIPTAVGGGLLVVVAVSLSVAAVLRKKQKI